MRRGIHLFYVPIFEGTVTLYVKEVPILKGL